MEKKNKLSDVELINFIQQGNLHYFSELSTRYEGYIIKKCKTYVKDTATAEDLCQEIFIKIFLKINRFQKKANFSTWLYSIIHNTCIDFLRKNKKNSQQVLTEKMIDQVAELIEDTDEVPEEISLQILEQLLNSISPEEKLLLLLKYKEKHSIKDIQVSLQLSESAVKMRLKRAKEKINALYKTRVNKEQ
ncbi:MAG: RNA polymerase sigma factor [Fulvivirga sp.]|nr:RNA polymerase sigma factor [Fulvivirga sp.]